MVISTASVAGIAYSASAAQAQPTSMADLVASLAWIVLAVSALLIAVGALIVFTKLAKLIDRLEDHLKKK